jgi:type IV pilus assembly protein PilZ
VEVRVDYRTLNGFFADYARNFSRAWSFIRTDKPFEVGTELEYRLSAPGLSLVIRGNVEETRADGMRVGFYYRTPEERRDNERLIRRRMLEELGPELSARLLG